jgi:membrane protease YdiL (CAAX protease family)
MNTAIITKETPTGATHILHALIDIGIIVLFSALGYGIEFGARSAGIFSLGDLGSGLLGVMGGLIGVLFVTKRRGFSYADLGFKRPQPLWAVPLWVIGIFVVYAFAQAAVPGVLSVVIDLPAPDFSRYDSVYQNLPLALFLLVALPLTASIPEEMIYRGFLMDRLARIFGKGTSGTVLTVAVQALIFGTIHFQWGIGGILITVIMGLIWGTAFILSGRNLWIVILAHSFGHTVWIILLYLSPPGAR